MNTRVLKLPTMSLLTLFIALTPLTGFSGSIDRTYWDRAVEIAEKNKCLAPLNIVETEKVSDANGKPVERNVTHIQVIKTGGTALDIKLVSREENGKDTTDNFYKDFLANKGETLSELKEEGLFEKSSQGLIKLTNFNLEGKVAIYSFTMRAEGVSFSGQAEICAIKGHALSTKITASEMEEDDVVISNFEETTQFKRNGDQWYAEKVIETMDIEMGGFFTSFEGSVQAETVLADYFCNK